MCGLPRSPPTCHIAPLHLIACSVKAAPQAGETKVWRPYLVIEVGQEAHKVPPLVCQEVPALVEGLLLVLLVLAELVLDLLVLLLLLAQNVLLALLVLVQLLVQHGAHKVQLHMKG